MNMENEEEIYYTRNCPKCNKVLMYKNKGYRNSAVSANRLCSSCSNTGDKNPFYGKNHTEEHKVYISKTLKTSEAHKKSRIIVSEKLKGKPKSETTKLKLSESIKEWHKYNENPMSGRTHTPETKNKIRSVVRKWVENYRKTDSYKDWASKKDEYELYRIEVDRITKSNDLRKLKNFSKKNLYHKYEVDHIYPISMGFKNEIPAYLIGHIDNLRIIPMDENRNKRDKIIEDIIPTSIKKYIDETKNDKYQ